MSPKKQVQLAKPKAKKSIAVQKTLQKPTGKSQAARRVVAKGMAPDKTSRAVDAETKSPGQQAAVVASKEFRAQQSAFLMYLNAGKKAKDADHQGSCKELKDWYGGLSQERKREVIRDFFSAGGRKSGVDKLMSVSMVSQQKNNSRCISNWATPRAIATHWTVAH